MWHLHIIMNLATSCWAKCFNCIEFVFLHNCCLSAFHYWHSLTSMDTWQRAIKGRITVMLGILQNHFHNTHKHRSQQQPKTSPYNLSLQAKYLAVTTIILEKMHCCTSMTTMVMQMCQCNYMYIAHLVCFSSALNSMHMLRKEQD